MRLLHAVFRFVSLRVTAFLEKPLPGYQPFTPSDPETLRRVLQPGDVVLVEGNRRMSAAIKYLTQSTWSHAAIYVGNAVDAEPGSDGCMLVEADVKHGVVAVPLSKYADFNTRICRASRLRPEDRDAIVHYAIGRIGDTYDMRNVFDLLRYLLPTPPVPVRYRRRMLALGAGDPTRAICSTMIAQAFQEVGYPILPLISTVDDPTPRVASSYTRNEILHIRHYSLFVPRDFDVSPFFSIIKPTIEGGFDYKSIVWADEPDTPASV